MELIERRFPGFSLVCITEGVASAAVELHRGYFTYYWRSRLDQADFLKIMRDMHRERNINSTSVTFVDSVGKIEEVAAKKEISGRPDFFENVKILASDKEARRCSLLRFDGLGQSWVWQYAPDDKELSKYTDAPYREGLVPYTGCAFSAGQRSMLEVAHELLERSAIEPQHLVEHLDLLTFYINRWKGVHQ